MCAINGAFAFGGAAVSVELDELFAIRDHMAARGPDGCGYWMSSDRRVALGHRRLSIIDLTDRAIQPMLSADNRYIVTFNGEIYNYRELRKDLQRRGALFLTESDTEVLLHLYALYGPDMVKLLRGMFAFAIWDCLRSELFLARDPYGIKPLYYCVQGGIFRFASQTKALLASSAVSREPDPAGLVGFCIWGSVPEPRTIYQSIRSIPAGTSAIVSLQGVEAFKRYYSISEVYCMAEASGKNMRSNDASAVIGEGLRDSVRHHLVSDVPIGAFLSAGIDSAALVGLMRDAGASNFETVTLTFEEFLGRNEDEAPIAAQVAKAYGVRHTARVVSKEEFNSDVAQFLSAMDQPSIDGLNTWFVSKAAKEMGWKVAISGLGGDEIFGGYPSFVDIPRWTKQMALPSSVPLFGAVLRWALHATGLDQQIRSPKAAGMVEYGGTVAGAYMLRRAVFMPWELGQILGQQIARDGLSSLDPMGSVEDALTPSPRETFAQIAVLESSLYMRNQLLRDADWASMAHGVEVRVPLVDATLLDVVAPFAGQMQALGGKRVLAQSPSVPLPLSVTKRSKTGFGVPLDAWTMSKNDVRSKIDRASRIRQDSRAWAKSVLASQAI